MYAQINITSPVVGLLCQFRTHSIIHNQGVSLHEYRLYISQNVQFLEAILQFFVHDLAVYDPVSPIRSGILIDCIFNGIESLFQRLVTDAVVDHVKAVSVSHFVDFTDLIVRDQQQAPFAGSVGVVLTHCRRTSA